MLYVHMALSVTDEARNGVSPGGVVALVSEAVKGIGRRARPQSPSNGLRTPRPPRLRTCV